MAALWGGTRRLHDPWPLRPPMPPVLWPRTLQHDSGKERPFDLRDALPSLALTKVGSTHAGIPFTFETI